MWSRILTGTGVSSGIMLPALSGGILFAHEDELHISHDGGKTIAASWPLPHKTINLIRIGGGRLMSVSWRAESDEMVIKLGGGSYFAAFSDDDGKTWGQEKKIHEGEYCYYTMNDRLFAHSSGRILMPVCLHPKSMYDVPLEAAGHCGAMYTDDQGLTWQWSNWVEGHSVGNHLAEPMIVEVENGAMIMFMRTFTGHLYSSVSTDCGKTWQNEQNTGVRMPNSPFCVKRDPYSNLIFLVWINSFPSRQYNNPRSPLVLGVSFDNARTFQFVQELESDPFGRFCYPAIMFTKESILVSYSFNHDESRKFNWADFRLRLASLDRSELNVRIPVEHRLFE